MRYKRYSQLCNSSHLKSVALYGLFSMDFYIAEGIYKKDGLD
ncbi:hypothetical protein HMPREF9372_3669 [Sporosarcina newyorkensis 2681]|uniref:Uncharacterized protein n=1 Tax=Sporosarcina newyorkensis 2681 TaxID=1027292 RepID=F9DXY8_9BACL|nr:hypothetical protein HMPREF9372_3669 [Sporosarcina newyorkensis 2681]